MLDVYIITRERASRSWSLISRPSKTPKSSCGCADASGDAEDARAAIAAEFEVSDITADAIPALQ
jgi:hypothetical protein